MAKIIGRFYLKKTSNGNLIGEFSNITNDVYTESADLVCDSENIDIDISNFIGVYKSSWRDGDEPHFAILNITYKTKRIFNLKWEGNKISIESLNISECKTSKNGQIPWNEIIFDDGIIKKGNKKGEMACQTI